MEFGRKEVEEKSERFRGENIEIWGHVTKKSYTNCHYKNSEESLISHFGEIKVWSKLHQRLQRDMILRLV